MKRADYKNKFISVNNNFSTSLRSRIGSGSLQIPLVATPTKLGNFGYITVENTNGGQIVFFNAKLSNILFCDIADRGQDRTTPVGRAGGTLVQQRVIAANVGQNQAALVSVLTLDDTFVIGRAGTDPHRDELSLSVRSGYTGDDKFSINAVILRSTSGIFSLGGQIKKAMDKYFVGRMKYNEDTGSIGDNMVNQLTFINVPSVNSQSLRTMSNSARYQNYYSKLSVGAMNALNNVKILDVSTSAYVSSSNDGRGFVISRKRSRPTPLMIVAQDVVFLQKAINPVGFSMRTSMDDVGEGDSQYGIKMATQSSSLENKVQLFNVRSSSVFQPYTVVATHWDSRIDSQLIRKDDDFFMSTYNDVGGLSSSGGTLTVRRSIGSGVSGDRWRLAYNRNLLTDGRNFQRKTLSVSDNLAIEAVHDWRLQVVPYGGPFGEWGSTRDMTTVFNLYGNNWSFSNDISSIVRSVIDRGWFFVKRGTSVQRGNISSVNFDKLGFTDTTQNWIGQIFSYSQSIDKIGLFNRSFIAMTNGGSATAQINKTGRGILLIPITKAGDVYTLHVNEKKYLTDIRTTSITSTYGYLYSVSRDVQSQFLRARSSQRICRVLFAIGDVNGTTVSDVIISQVKLQRGLQRTRYGQQRAQTLTRKIHDDMSLEQLVIQNKKYGDNLFVSTAKYKDRDSATAGINFGKFIPLGSQNADPYRAQRRAFFWKYYDRRSDKPQGFSLLYQSCTRNGSLIQPYFKQSTSTPLGTDQYLALDSLGGTIRLLKADGKFVRPSNFGTSDYGILLKTFPYQHGSPSNLLHVGNIKIRADRSASSMLRLYAQNSISLSRGRSLSSTSPLRQLYADNFNIRGLTARLSAQTIRNVFGSTACLSGSVSAFVRGKYVSLQRDIDIINTSLTGITYFNYDKSGSSSAYNIFTMNYNGGAPFRQVNFAFQRSCPTQTVDYRCKLIDAINISDVYPVRIQLDVNKITGSAAPWHINTTVYLDNRIDDYFYIVATSVSDDASDGDGHTSSLRNVFARISDDSLTIVFENLGSSWRVWLLNSKSVGGAQQYWCMLKMRYIG